MAQTTEPGRVLGLPIFAGEPIIITRHDDAGDQIAALDDEIEWFVRPTTVSAPTSLHLTDVLRITKDEHRTLSDDFGVPVVDYTYGFIDVSNCPEIVELYHDDPYDRQTHEMPPGLQLAARVRVVRAGQHCGPPEDRGDPFDWADSYYFSPSKTGHKVSECYAAEQFAHVDHMRPMYVDVEPRIEAQTWL